MRRKIRFDMKNEDFTKLSEIRITTNFFVQKLVKVHNQHIASPMTDNNNNSQQTMTI